MLYKLHSCVDQTTFSAIRNMYDNMTSCVSNVRLVSNFARNKARRQIIAVYLSCLYRRSNKGARKSGHGLSLYGLNLSCPTVADDMVLISLSMNGLQQMLNI